MNYLLNNPTEQHAQGIHLDNCLKDQNRYNFKPSKPPVWVSQVALVVKSPIAHAGDIRDAGLIPGSGRSPGEGMATHSSILAWRIPQTEELDGLQSIGSQRGRHH